MVKFKKILASVPIFFMVLQLSAQWNTSDYGRIFYGDLIVLNNMKLFDTANIKIDTMYRDVDTIKIQFTTGEVFKWFKEDQTGPGGSGGEVDTSGTPMVNGYAYFTSANKIGTNYVSTDNFNIGSVGNQIRLGNYAGSSTPITSSTYGIAIGYYSLNNTTTLGNNNVAVGYASLRYNVSGDFNTAIGDEAGMNLTSGGYNSYFGYRSGGGGANTHNSNVGIGAFSLYDNLESNNTAVGFASLRYNSSGAANCAIGEHSLYNNTTGTQNIALGFQSGYHNTTLSNRLFISSIDTYTTIAEDSLNSIIYGLLDAVSSNQQLYLNSNVRIKHNFNLLGNATIGDAATDEHTINGKTNFNSISLTSDIYIDPDEETNPLIQINNTGYNAGISMISNSGIDSVFVFGRSITNRMRPFTVQGLTVNDTNYIIVRNSTYNELFHVREYDTKINNILNVNANSILDTVYYTNVDVGTDTVGLIGYMKNGKFYIDTAQLTQTSGTTSSTTTEHIRVNDTVDYFVFGAGVGNSIDTNAFSTSNFYGAFYNSEDTISVTALRSVLQGISPSVTVQISWHATLGSGSATVLNTTAPTITSTTTGDNDISFDNADIPPGVWVWCTTPTVTTKPTMLLVNLTGYKK